MRVRIGLFPVPDQGYPRSLCPKTLAINLRGASGASANARRPGRAASMAVAACRRQDSFTSCITLMGWPLTAATTVVRCRDGRYTTETYRHSQWSI